MLDRLKGHWQLCALIVLVFALWQTPLMTPLKILVVFFHELAHAIATVLTGGRVLSLSISADQGGMVMSLGGNRFLTLTAGYLGSLVIGAGLLVAALRTRADKLVMALCGAVMILVAALYIRDAFALVFCLGTGAVMIAVSRFLGHSVNDLALRVIGLTSMIYVPYDILSDTILRSSARSDARMLAEEFGGATVIWGGIWLAISLVMIFWALKMALVKDSNINWSDTSN